MNFDELWRSNLPQRTDNLMREPKRKLLKAVADLEAPVEATEAEVNRYIEWLESVSHFEN